MMPKVPPVQYSAMAPVHDDSNPSHSNPITSPQIFGWSVWGAFQLTETLPPAGTSRGIAGPWGSAAKFVGCVRAEEGEGLSLRQVTWSGLRKPCMG